MEQKQQTMNIPYPYGIKRNTEHITFAFTFFTAGEAKTITEEEKLYERQEMLKKQLIYNSHAGN